MKFQMATGSGVGELGFISWPDRKFAASAPSQLNMDGPQAEHGITLQRLTDDRQWIGEDGVGRDLIFGAAGAVIGCIALSDVADVNICLPGP